MAKAVHIAVGHRQGRHRSEWEPSAAFLLFVLGFLAVWFYIRSIDAADSFKGVVLFDLWTFLLGGLAGFALASCVYFVSWLRGIIRLSEETNRRQVMWQVVGARVLAVVLILGAVSLFLAAAAGGADIEGDLGAKTRPITLIVGISLVPGLVGFLMLRFVAIDEVQPELPLDQLRLLLRLRAELQRLLATFGAFLTLLVIATGVRRKALLAVDPSLQIPAEGVLLYGLIFAVMLGLFYIAANGAVAYRADVILESYAPLPDPADPELSQGVAKRKDLSFLTGGGGSWSTFQTSVVIAAPLLSALIGSATGK
jgi:hypothetical protein